MPALSPAPQRQSRVASQFGTEAGLQATQPAHTLGASSTLVRRWTPTSSLVAAAVVESSPVSPTAQKPSNEVVGGAFVGAFLGLLVLLLLINYCRGRGYEGSDKSSSDSSPPSSPRAPPHIPPQAPFNGPPNGPYGTGPIPPPPVYSGSDHPPRPTRAQSGLPRTRTMIAEVEGRPMLVVKRAKSPRRPRKHRRAELGSESSSSYRHRIRVSHCRSTTASRMLSCYRVIDAAKELKYMSWICPGTSECLDLVRCSEKLDLDVVCLQWLEANHASPASERNAHAHRHGIDPQFMHLHVTLHFHACFSPYLLAINTNVSHI
jgi:hypothetical protein